MVAKSKIAHKFCLGMFQIILIGQYRRDNFEEYTENFWVSCGHCSVRQAFEEM